MKSILCIFLCAVMALSAAACVSSKAQEKSQNETEAQETTMRKYDFSEEQKYLESALKKINFSGVVRITKDGQTACEVALGNRNTDTKNTADTRFCIGSVSKQFTAAAIMMLQQENKLSVNDKLEKYFPEYKIGKDLTIKNLLTMRSGIPEFYDVDYIDNAFTERPTGELRKTVTNDNTAEENRELLEKWLFEQPLTFKPDSSYEYSNSNYFLLARIVEKVTGGTFNDYVRDNIFKPLGMTNSFFIDDVNLKTLENLAAPTVDPQTVYVGVTMGLGDIITNADDMDKWLTSLRTNKLLTEENYKAMTSDYSPEDENVYGYGLIPDEKGGAYHYGYITTFHAMDYTDVDKGINLFAVTNDNANIQGNLSEICHLMIEKVMNRIAE